eukprot:scaffold667_cov262-Pinguiococcus_pyrenoidosus.AAC.9
MADGGWQMADGGSWDGALRPSILVLVSVLFPPSCMYLGPLDFFFFVLSGTDGYAAPRLALQECAKYILRTFSLLQVLDRVQEKRGAARPPQKKQLPDPRGDPLAAVMAPEV